MYLCCAAFVLLYVVGARGWWVLLFQSSIGVAAYQEQDALLRINVYFSSAATVHTVVLRSYMVGEWVCVGWCLGELVVGHMGGFVYRSSWRRFCCGIPGTAYHPCCSQIRTCLY